MPITAGVNHPEMTSARRAIGARRDCASRTRRTICCSAVSAPTRVALNRSAPVVFIVAPNTVEPGAFSTGHRFAREHRLVYRGRALDHLAVHREAFARADDDDVAGEHLAGRHVEFDAVADDARAARLEADQALDGFRRAAAGAGLEEFADEHQRDDDDRRLEVDRSVRRAGPVDACPATACGPGPTEPGAESRHNRSGATVAASEYRNAAPVPTATSVFMSAVAWRRLFQAPR